VTPEAQQMSQLVGRGVESLRDECRLSQKGLAGALGWTQQKISRIEAGRELRVYEFITLRAFFMERLQLPQPVVDEKLVTGGASPRLRLVTDDGEANAKTSSGRATKVYAHPRAA
jgi:DNA-binding XRE family transcriptional regulator